MKYDFNKIKIDLGELKAPVDLIEHISGLAERANKGEDVTSGLRSLVNGLTETVSDAENSPLNSSQQHLLEADMQVLGYLRKLVGYE